MSFRGGISFTETCQVRLVKRVEFHHFPRSWESITTKGKGSNCDGGRRKGVGRKTLIQNETVREASALLSIGILKGYGDLTRWDTKSPGVPLKRRPVLILEVTAGRRVCHGEKNEPRAVRRVHRTGTVAEGS